MPIRPGIIDADLIAYIRATIDEQFGPIPISLPPSQQTSADVYRQKLAIIVASGTQYARDNNNLNVGQTVAPGSFNIPGTGAVEGEGIVDMEGTWS